jgi:hypothetical protein
VAGFTFIQLDDIPDVPTATDPGDPAWKPIQHHLGLQAFGINAYVARAAGDALAEEHDEAGSGQEEVYIVLSGRVEFMVDGRRFEGAPGSVLALRDPSLRRSARALEAGATVLAVGCRPGCFETSWRPEHFAGLPRDASV